TGGLGHKWERGKPGVADYPLVDRHEAIRAAHPGDKARQLIRQQSCDKQIERFTACRAQLPARMAGKQAFIPAISQRHAWPRKVVLKLGFGDRKEVHIGASQGSDLDEGKSRRVERPMNRGHAIGTRLVGCPARWLARRIAIDADDDVVNLVVWPGRDAWVR